MALDGAIVETIADGRSNTKADSAITAAFRIAIAIQFRAIGTWSR